MRDKVYQNDQYAYQGQLKASSMPQGRFVPKDSLNNKINYFDRINQIYDGQISYISRLAIYWDKPNNARIPKDQEEQNRRSYITIVGQKDSQSFEQKFEIGYNYILQFHEPDLKIYGIYVNQQSTPNCFFDFIAK